MDDSIKVVQGREAVISPEQIVLEKLRYHLRQTIDRRLLSAHISIDWDSMLHAVLIQVDGFVWARELSRQEVRYPADWWQAFKRRWMPAFILRRWPVRETIVTVHAKAFYPTMRYEVAGNEAVIAIVKDLPATAAASVVPWWRE